MIGLRNKRTVARASAAGLAIIAAGAMVLSVTGQASAAGGNTYTSWSIPNVPSAGLSNIVFPMTVNPATVRADGTYFASQFNFTHASDVGYTGLQPRADLNGHQRLHGVFSSFNAGTSSTDPNCHGGADSGAGESCSAEFDAVYGHTYNMTVTRTGTDTWTGTAVDAVTGVANHIGTYTLPAGSGNIAGGQTGFVEYYLSSPTCAQLPKVDVQFDGPTSTDLPGQVGTVRNAGESADCQGQSNFVATNVGNGLHVTRGWIDNNGGSTGGGGGTGATLVNKASGRCLDDTALNTANGTQQEIWDCNGGTNQQWTAGAGNTLTTGGKCLDASGNGTTAGTKVILWDCNGGTNQKWTLP